MTIKEWINKCHAAAIENGDWENGDKSFSEICANLHLHVSRAFEIYKYGYGIAEIEPSLENNMPDGVPIRIAGLLKTVFDFCGKYNVDVEKALELRINYDRYK